MKVKIPIITLMLFGLAFQMFAQQLDTLNQTDENGLKQGFWIKKDKYGRVLYKGRFQDDIPVGEFEYFYDDGKIKARSQIKNMGKDSWTVTYHKNGRVMSEGAYKNQQKDSVWTFYDLFGQVLTTETYDSGVLQGNFVTFYQSGDTTEILYYKNDLKHGGWKQFYKNGQLKTDGWYVHDTLDDSITFYHKNGRVMMAGKYDMGLRIGDWKHFDEDGIPELIEHYKDGVKTGQEMLLELKPKKNQSPESE